MCRIFKLIDATKFYWTGRYWQQGDWSALPIPNNEALELAVTKDADIEELS